MDHRIAAYTASKLGTQDLVGTILGTDVREEEPLGRAITQRLVEALGLPEEEVTVENLEGYNQKALSVKIDE